VSDKNENDLELLINNKMSGANTIYSNSNDFKNTYINIDKQIVKSISFDKIINQYNITNIHLLKIDCKGAEYDIIYSSELFKNKIVKNIVGEFHDLKALKNTINVSSELINYCKQYVDGVVKISTLNLTNNY